MKRASEKEGNSVHKKPKSDINQFRLIRFPQNAIQNHSLIKNKSNGASPNSQIETIVLSSDEENDDPAPSFKPKPKAQSSTSAAPASQDLRSLGFTISKQSPSVPKQPTEGPNQTPVQSPLPNVVSSGAVKTPKIADIQRNSSSTDGPKVLISIKKTAPVIVGQVESSDDETKSDKNQDMETASNEPQSNLSFGMTDDDELEKEEIDELDSDSDVEDPTPKQKIGYSLASQQPQPQPQPQLQSQPQPQPMLQHSRLQPDHQQTKSSFDQIVNNMQDIQKPLDINAQNQLLQTAAAMRKLPVRESRSRVTTYNDIANSVDPTQFAVDYLSSADDESEIDAVGFSNAFRNNDNSSVVVVQHNKLSNLPRPRRQLKTGFVYDTAMSYHATPDDTEIHPEDPRRIFKIFNIMERHGLLSECKRIKSRRATKEEVLLVHNITHYRTLRNTSGTFFDSVIVFDILFNMVILQI